jgi:hypothetical protein
VIGGQIEGGLGSLLFARCRAGLALLLRALLVVGVLLGFALLFVRLHLTFGHENPPSVGAAIFSGFDAGASEGRKPPSPIPGCER